MGQVLVEAAASISGCVLHRCISKLATYTRNQTIRPDEQPSREALTRCECLTRPRWVNARVACPTSAACGSRTIRDRRTSLETSSSEGPHPYVCRRSPAMAEAHHHPPLIVSARTAKRLLDVGNTK